MGKTGSFFWDTAPSVVSNTLPDASPAELSDIGGSTAQTLLPPVHIPKLNLTKNNTSFFNKYIDTSRASSNDAQCFCVSNVQSSVDCNVQFLEASKKQAQVSTIHQAYLRGSRDRQHGNVYAVQHTEAYDRRYNSARNALICGSREPQLHSVCDFCGDALSVQPHGAGDAQPRGTVDVQLRGADDEQPHCAPDEQLQASSLGHLNKLSTSPNLDSHNLQVKGRLKSLRLYWKTLGVDTFI